MAEQTYPSRDFDGLAPLIQAFVAAHPGPIDASCFGVPGPVQEGHVETPNLPWVIDASALASLLRLPSVGLINDLEANAWGIGALDASDFAILQAGRPGATGNGAVISAGTGLGQAGLYWDGRMHRPFASEGGHTDFAPRDPLEAELLAHVRRRWEHVSYERIVSGPGIVHIYEFLRDSGRHPEQAVIAARMRAGDPAAAIAQAALAGECPLSRASIALFVSLYGAAAGNLALTLLATGGVYIGGGIAPKLLPKMREPGFIDAFLGKGRMRALLEAIPVRVILNPNAALLGAGRYAALRGDSIE